MSVLLRQPQGFEGFRAILKVIFPDYQSSAEREELKNGLAHGHTASLSLSDHLGRHENAVSAVDEFLGIEPSVEAAEPLSPKLTVAVMTVEDRACVREHMCRVKLDGGIKAVDEQVEVASIERCVALSDTADEHRSAQSRTARHPRPRCAEQTVEPREVDDDPFIQRPVTPRIRYERDSDGSRGLHVLLRHRPRSIPQAQESA